MFNLKSAYFYFLATKIKIIKFIKKIYFRTSAYNKSLKSDVPKQFYFYPNPFLLSSLTSNRNFSFKVSKIDKNMFWEKQNSKKDERNLQSFLWLNLIDRKNDSAVIQKIITVWIHKNSKYRNVIWESSVISKRIISWILNSEIILNNTDNLFKNNFFQSIIVQTNHLKKNLRFENDFQKRVEINCAILLTGLVFKEYSKNYENCINELKKSIDDFFDSDGFPINRNPNCLVQCLKYLILIKECIKDAQKYVPEYLDEIIEKQLTCLNTIVNPDNQLPLFNGATENNQKNFIDYIERLNYKFNKSIGMAGGLQIIKHKKNIIYFDVSNAPKKEFSSSYQSGPLSFEYFLDKIKVITNCGYGANISNKATLLSKLTSAQSSASLNDTSVVKFERSKFINEAFGNSITENFKTFDINFIQNEKIISSNCSHDAYEKIFGYIFNREIGINKDNSTLFGIDKFISKKISSNAFYNIRFHLYPGISAVRTIGTKSILIQVKKNQSLIFTAKDENISVEKSIFLGGNKILNNLCILISGKINDSTKIINWEFKKNI